MCVLYHQLGFDCRANASLLMTEHSREHIWSTNHAEICVKFIQLQDLAPHKLNHEIKYHACIMI